MKMQKNWLALYRNWRRWVALPVVIILLIAIGILRLAYMFLIFIGELIADTGYRIKKTSFMPSFITLMIEWVQEADK